MLQFLLRHISFRTKINLGYNSLTMNENSPQKMFMTWEKNRSLRNLSLSVIIMVPKWNSVSVVTASSHLITPNNHSTICIHWQLRDSVSRSEQSNYFLPPWEELLLRKKKSGRLQHPFCESGVSHGTDRNNDFWIRLNFVQYLTTTGWMAVVHNWTVRIIRLVDWVLLWYSNSCCRMSYVIYLFSVVRAIEIGLESRPE
jgi:hypothetical protein